MDLSTRYLGLELAHPFMPGASPLADTIESVLQLEDAGASAIVMSSLFEEEVAGRGAGPDLYLERLLRTKQRVGVPVIASLNGTTTEGWLQYARMIERAGADALELNFYYVATSALEGAGAVERRVIDLVAVLKESIAIPVAVKLSPFYSSLPNLAAQLDRMGADGLVLFNRFYQPDIDPESLDIDLTLDLSDSSELLLRLRWIGILFNNVRASLAVTGGIHTAIDGVKAVLAGADAVQIVSALLEHGPKRLTQIVREFEQWGDQHHYASLREMRGRVSLSRCPTPSAFERGNYVRMLQTWRRTLNGGAS